MAPDGTARFGLPVEEEVGHFIVPPPSSWRPAVLPGVRYGIDTSAAVATTLPGKPLPRQFFNPWPGACA